MNDSSPIRVKLSGLPLKGSGGRLRRFVGKWEGVYGRLDFQEQGLYFSPYRVERFASGVVPQFLATWDEVLAVDLDGLFGGSAGLAVVRRDRTSLSVGAVNQDRCEDALAKLDFQPHERASWPNHRVFTRSEADWRSFLNRSE